MRLARPSRLSSILRELLHDRRLVVELVAAAVRTTGQPGGAATLRVAIKGA